MPFLKPALLPNYAPARAETSAVFNFSAFTPLPHTYRYCFDYQVVVKFILDKTLFIKRLFLCFGRRFFVCLGKDFYLFPLNEKLYSAKIKLRNPCKNIFNKCNRN